MRSPLRLLVVLLACASLSSTDSFAARPIPDGGTRIPRGALLLTPDCVSPGPGEFGASAYTTFRSGRNGVSFYMTITQLSGWISTIGVYKAQPGQTGPMVVRLSPSPIGINQLNGTIPVTDSALLTDLSRHPENYFIQINTNAYPGGALRVQLR